MKKNITKLVVIILFAAFSNNSFAQKIVDISPFYGWQMNGKVKFYQGELKTDDNPLYGITMDVMVAPDMGLRLLYSRTETKSHFVPYLGAPGSGFDPKDFNLANEYY